MTFPVSKQAKLQFEIEATAERTFNRARECNGLCAGSREGTEQSWSVDSQSDGYVDQPLAQCYSTDVGSVKQNVARSNTLNSLLANAMSKPAPLSSTE